MKWQEKILKKFWEWLRFGRKLKKMEKTKYQRWLEAVRSPHPRTMLINKLSAQVGVVIGMFAALVTLVITKVWWLLYFMPFIWFIQVLELINTRKQLQQFDKAQAQLKELMEAGKK